MDAGGLGLAGAGDRILAVCLTARSARLREGVRGAVESLVKQGPRMQATAIVLAAGLGTRMRSSLPKTLHRLAGRSMLRHLLATCEGVFDRIVVVLGPDMDAVRREAEPHVCVVQQDRLGTAHAALRAAGHFGDGVVAVLYADNPLIRPATLRRLLDGQAPVGGLSGDGAPGDGAPGDGAPGDGAPGDGVPGDEVPGDGVSGGRALGGKVSGGKVSGGLSLLAFRPDDAGRYGRVIIDADGLVSGIVEYADASPEQLAVGLCNAGVLCGWAGDMRRWLGAVGCDNAKREYYLTDVVGLARAEGRRVTAVEAAAEELAGVNSRAELARAEAVLQGWLREAAMAAGVTMVDPASVFLSADTELAADVTIEPNVFFGPGVSVAGGVQIRAFSHLEGAHVGPGCVIGPFARLRPGAVLEPAVHVGNFVEIKASRLGSGVKAHHLSYIGDATVGSGSNIGAGTITCNYDGTNKHRTTIGANVFVGSDVALVAPVSVGDGAVLAAGSVITEDVAADALALARGRQVQKPGRAPAIRAAARRVKERRAAADGQAGERPAGDGQAGDRQAGERPAVAPPAVHGQAVDGQVGDQQVGDRQAGEQQAGDRQAVHGQAGDRQAGERPTGDRHVGDRRAGDFLAAAVVKGNN